MILIDVDGVMYNLLDAIKMKYPNFNPENVVSYDFKCPDLGISREEIMKCLKDPYIFASEPLYEGVHEGLEKLKDLDECVAYTSVPDSCMSVRCKQLLDIDLKGMISTDLCKPMIECTALIEDNPEMLLKYKGTNTIRICIERPYNMGCDCDYMAKNLSDAYNFLLSMY